MNPETRSPSDVSSIGPVKAAIPAIPSVRLTPEQIEEIHADEYSLVLFYATRVRAVGLAEIKRLYPEPEPKKAESVLERFRKVGLVKLTDDGKYYSIYPDNYINYSNYRYDGDLESKKDAKVFATMKEHTGQKEYWKDKMYFSIDGFFKEEQTNELLDMFKEIRMKAKYYSDSNKGEELKSIKFRRMKFYDMPWATMLVMCLLISSTVAFAHGGGNDPTETRLLRTNAIQIADMKSNENGGAMIPMEETAAEMQAAEANRFFSNLPNSAPCSEAVCDAIMEQLEELN